MRVAVETYGCTMNQADSDIMRGLISRHFDLSSPEEAEVVVLNSCGVIEFTERKILKRIQELKKEGKKVVLAGCLTIISNEAVKICDSAISPTYIDKIVEVINSVASGKKIVIKNSKDLDKSKFFEIKRRLDNTAIAIVSIAEGCLGNCSFCATKLARGRLRSFSMDSIIEEVKMAIRSGFREIQLTSQDTGSYGLDKGRFMLPNLIENISKLDGEFRVRIGMMNPRFAFKMLDDLLNAYADRKVYKFIHIPVQSGDNKVLKDMRRNHTVEDYIEVVRKFRRSFEDVLVSTDIIVGYPTESEESFWKTYDLIRETKPDIVNITRFSPRRGTIAATLKDIPSWIKKNRSRLLTNLSRRIGFENNKKFIGRELRVLITKFGKKRTMLARSDSYRPVVLKSGRIGEFKVVKISDCKFNYLMALN